MKYALYDNVSCFELDYESGSVLYIEKSHIHQLSMVDRGIARLDMGKGETRHIYLNYEDINNMDFSPDPTQLLAFLQEGINNVLGAGLEDSRPLQVSFGAPMPDGTNVVGSLFKTGTYELARFSRSADTTPYAPGQIVSPDSMYNFSFDASRGNCYGLVKILAVRLYTNMPGCTARFRLHFYRLYAEAGDYANYGFVPHEYFDRENGDIHNWCGSIELPACTPHYGSPVLASAQVTDCNLLYQPPYNVIAIQVLMETLDAFTPNPYQTFWIELTTIIP